MAAPRYAPVPVTESVRTYSSPDEVPGAWEADRGAEIEGRQPAGVRLGYQGPDQGYMLLLAGRMRARVCTGPGEHAEDALAGCVLIALRRASLFGRAPVAADLELALCVWGFLVPGAPADLLAARTEAFGGLHHLAHHYAQGRALADAVPAATLRLSPREAAARMPGGWRELTGWAG